MNLARIAELLQPFLGTDIGVSHVSPRVHHPSESSTLAWEPVTAGPNACHSEGSSVPEESASLTPSQLQNISTYIDLLLRWNAHINLTAIRDPEEIVTRHFGESFFTARQLFPLPNPATGLIDLGSGAGFPGLPIKLWAPDLHLTLIESNQKKATFLREAARSLTLPNVDVFSGRAENFPTPAANVTLRAVERFESILPTAARLVAPGGCIALLIGQSQSDLARLSLPKFRWLPPVPIPQSSTRILLIGANQTS